MEYVSGEFDTYDQISLTAAQEETLVAAMRKDVSLGTLEKSASWRRMGLRAMCPCTSNMSIRTAHGIAGNPVCHPEATHTLEALRELGLPEEALQ